MTDTAETRRVDGLIDDLDLEPIVYKLTHPEPGEDGLTLAQADQDVTLYRCFLKLCARYPDTPIVPTRRIDRVWHAHICDTAKYRQDCETVFGGPLDHFPYLGMRGPDDEQALADKFGATCDLFISEFGIDLTAETANPCQDHGDHSYCSPGASCEDAMASGARPRPDRTAA